MDTKQSVRKAGVSGMFYPGSADEIRHLLDNALEREGDALQKQAVTGHIAGGVVPHAGMIYCARQAVHFFEHCRRNKVNPDTVVIVHPNHAGAGPAISTDGYAFWETPLGKVPADMSMAGKLNIPVSAEAQAGEHSAEVLLPYLQHFLPDGFQILSVNMLSQRHDLARQLGKNIVSAARALSRNVLVLASSDFSHFLSPAESKVLDDMVLQQIFSRNASGVEETVRRHQVSVCGFGPVMALMEYAGELNADYKVHMLKRGHSGEVSPSHKVVNYVSLLFETDAE